MAIHFGRNIFFALAGGIIGSTLLPLVRPVASRNARPAAKMAIRAGVAMYEQARQTIGELAETASDLLAEVQAEQEAERDKQPESATARESKEGEQVIPFEFGPGSESEKKRHA